jgi:hypothetical protein
VLMLLCYHILHGDVLCRRQRVKKRMRQVSIRVSLLEYIGHSSLFAFRGKRRGQSSLHTQNCGESGDAPRDCLFPPKSCRERLAERRGCSAMADFDISDWNLSES